MKKFLPKAQRFDPTILVLFGISGDLASKMILPALYHLERHNWLPRDFRVVGVARRDLLGNKLASYISSVVKKSEKKVNVEILKRLSGKISFVRGSAEDLSTYKQLGEALDKIERQTKMCANRLFYFSTPPTLFPQIAQMIKNSGLLKDCTREGRKLRVLIEKPFGHDEKTARDLNKSLLSCFSEEQIYRIDHYQGKETVQNLIVVRFGNALLEPLWNSQYIDHIEISVLESLGIEGRGEYYDATGALSDMVQNHLLQLLALTAMDEPKELKTDLIRDEKVKILSALNFDKSFLVRGQFLGYQQEIGNKSKTETYIALKANLNLPRWRGVPFYLRTGKRLDKKVTEISIHFKELPKCLFHGCAGNILTFRIQPDEAVYLRINNKIPGFGIELHQTNLEFSYHNTFKREIPSAYERLLLDFLQGDQRLFIRSDEIEAAWKFVDSIRSTWKSVPVVKYKGGSAGPAEAERLIESDGSEWHTR